MKNTVGLAWIAWAGVDVERAAGGHLPRHLPRHARAQERHKQNKLLYGGKQPKHYNKKLVFTYRENF